MTQELPVAATLATSVTAAGAITAPAATHDQPAPAIAAATPVVAPSSAAGGAAAAAVRPAMPPAEPPSRAHVILLVQMSKHESTRSYYEYTTIPDALEGALSIFETRLKEQHMGSQTVTYDLQNLFVFINELRDFKALSWDSTTGSYKAHDRSWLKAQLQAHLLAQQKP